MQGKHKLNKVTNISLMIISCLIMGFLMASNLLFPMVVQSDNRLDIVDFVVAKTSLRQSEPSLNNNGKFLSGYTSSVDTENFNWIPNASGKYVFYKYTKPSGEEMEEYFLISNYVSIDNDEAIKVPEYLEIPENKISIVDNPRYDKEFIYGYNYKMFADYIFNNSGNYFKYNDQYYYLTSGAPNYSLFDSADNQVFIIADAHYVKFQSFYYSLDENGNYFKNNDTYFILNISHPDYKVYDDLDNEATDLSEAHYVKFNGVETKIYLANNRYIKNSDPSFDSDPIYLENNRYIKNTYEFVHPTDDDFYTLDIQEGNFLLYEGNYYLLDRVKYPYCDEEGFTDGGKNTRSSGYVKISEGIQVKINDESSGELKNPTYSINPGLYIRFGLDLYYNVSEVTFSYKDDLITATSSKSEETTFNGAYKAAYYYDIYKASSFDKDGKPISYTLYNHEVKASTDYKTKNEKASFISTYFSNDELNNMYYKVGNNFVPVFSEVVVNTAKNVLNTDETVVLNNYKAQGNLQYGLSENQNIENLYVSFGDIYYYDMVKEKEINTFSGVLTSLTVQVRLSNKYYNNPQGILLATNDVIVQTEQYVFGYPDAKNHFWFQYFDLYNLSYYTSQDYQGDTSIVEHPEGKYTFLFTYYVLGSELKYEYEYVIHITENSIHSEFPTFNADILDSNAGTVYNPPSNDYYTDYLNYYYNFQSEEYPLYTYDASKFNISFNKIYNQDTYNYTTDFRTIQREVNLSTNTISEKSVLTYYLDKYENNVLTNSIPERMVINAKVRTILPSEGNDTLQYLDRATGYEYIYNKLYVYEYVYRNKTTNITPTDYLTSGAYGNYMYKLIKVVGINEEKIKNGDVETSLDSYSVYHYIDYDSNYENTNSVSFSEDKALPLPSLGLYKKELMKIETEITKTVDIVTTETMEYQQSLTVSNYSTSDPIRLFYEIEDSAHLTNNINIIRKYNFDLKISMLDGTPEKIISGKLVPSNDIACKVKNIDTAIVDSPTGEPNEISVLEITSTFNQSKKYHLLNRQVMSEFEYIVEREFYDLGEYTFVNKFAFSNIDSKNNSTIYKTTSKNVLDVTFDYPRGKYQKNGYNLYIFGVKIYFNKNNRTEFKDVKNGIYSEKTYLPEVQSVIDSASAPIIKVKDLMKKTLDGGGVSRTTVPNTNMPPISFDYYCTYSYTQSPVTHSNIIPISKIYKYVNFSYKDDNRVEVTGEPVEYYFTKDSYPTSDGYYEIVIAYTYEGIVPSPTFYQVFSFVIDNSSPSLSIRKQVENIVDKETSYLEWSPIDRNSYTNSPVRATWRVANYFQYEIQPYITKSNYEGIITSGASANGSLPTASAVLYSTSSDFTQKEVGYSIGGNFYPLQDKIGDSIYKFAYSNNLEKVPVMKVTLDKGEPTSKTYPKFYPSDFYNTKLVNEINEASTYEIEVIGYEWQLIIYSRQQSVDELGNSKTVGNYWGSGYYTLRLYYGSSNQSYLTHAFTIDTIDLSNLAIQKVDTAAIKPVIAYTEFISGSSNLMKEAFTFTYSPKTSGAPITTTYNIIPFASFSSGTQSIELLLNNSLTGISATEYIFGNSNSAKINLSYPYDYTFSKQGDPVYLGNIFEPNTSSIYVFNLKDSAGNTASYYTIYDKTAPKYFLEIEEEDYIKQYNIITDTARLNWGNYKAIEINPTDLKKIDFEYVFNDGLNYTPTAIEKILRNLYISSTTSHPKNLNYLNSLVKIFWNINNRWTEVETPTVEYYNHLVFTGNAVLTSDGSTNAFDKVIAKSYLLIPLNTVHFEYYDTNSDDTDIYYKNFNPSSGNTNTILAPTLNVLAEILVEKGMYANVELAKTAIKTNPTGAFGFYGEKKYIYTISDIVGNESGSTLWMNLDLTQAFAWGLFTTSSRTLTDSSRLGIQYITPQTAYATGQLYFSYLPGNGVTIPDSTISYKYYDFNTSFLSDYTIHSISYNDTNGYDFVFVNKMGTEDILDDDVYYYYSTNGTNDNNYNADGDKVSEILSTFPYSLNPSTNGWESLMNSFENSSYVDLTNPERAFSTILRPTYEGNLIYSQSGLYVFKRVYDDWLNPDGSVINREGLGNDTVIRYYAYYVDRYGIIDLTDILKIGEDIQFILGNYIATENVEEYGTYISASEIQSYQNISGSTGSLVNSYSKIEINNLFNTNKMYVDLSVAMDKYNQPKSFTSFMSEFSSAEEKMEMLGNGDINDYYSGSSDAQRILAAEAEFDRIMSSYLYNISSEKLKNKDYINTKFLIRMNFSLGTQSQKLELISTAQGTHNRIIKQSSGTSPYIYEVTQNQNVVRTNANSRAQLASIIFNQESSEYGAYTLELKDSAGVTEGEQLRNSGANEYTMRFSIDNTAPAGTFFGKYQTVDYFTNTLNDHSYAYDLFSSDLQKLENLNVKKESDTQSEFTYINYNSVNNETLMFSFEKTTNRYMAQINPFVVQVTKTDDAEKTTVIYSSILKPVTDSNGNITYKMEFEASSAVPAEKMAAALIDNSELTGGEATKWAIIIFDNSAQDATYHNLLSSAEDNATYNITIQYKGTRANYDGANSIAKNITYFYGKYSITIDNIKPLYNIIKLMENDVYVDKKYTTLPSGYKNIDLYYNSLTGSDLKKQKALENIFNAYYSSYQTRDANGKIVKYEDDFDHTFIQKYFFAIDKNFLFSKALYEDADGKGGGTSLDTYMRLFYREITDISNYKFSLTTDDYLVTPEQFSGHPIFVESNAVRPGGNSDYYYLEFLNVNSFKNEELEHLIPGRYYEIIERDEAGNYRVYAIFMTEEQKYNYTYKDAFDTTKSNYLNNSTQVITKDNEEVSEVIYHSNMVANGIDLSFNVDSSLLDNPRQDRFLKATINYSFNSISQSGATVVHTNNNSPIYIYNDPINKQIIVQPNNENTTNKINIYSPDPIDYTLDNREYEDVYLFFQNLEEIYKQIISEYKENANDFIITIKVFNRIGGIYTLTYNVPGKELKYIRRDIGNSGFSIEIPKDSSSRATQIFRMTIAKYTNGTWETLNLDSNNRYILTGDNTYSLGGDIPQYRTYFFSNGSYRFILEDNFARKSIYYEKHNTGEISSGVIYSGTTQKYYDQLYTAKDVVLRYDATVYKPFIYENTLDTNKIDNIILVPIIDNFAWNNDSSITDLFTFNTTPNITTRTTKDGTNNIYTITRTSRTGSNEIILNISQAMGYNTHFTILLIDITTIPSLFKEEEQMFSYNSLEDNSTIFFEKYDFNLYTVIPNITLKNLSGGTILYNSNQIFIEDLIVTWNTQNAYFSPVIELVRKYDGRTTTSTITSTNYTITNPGTYILTMFNTLGYRGTPISFTRDAGNTILYSVYTKEIATGLTNVLYESTYTSTKEVQFGATTKKYIMYNYYALNKFENYKTDPTTGKVISPDILKNHISIVTNTNNSIDYELIEHKASTPTEAGYAIYKIFTGIGVNEYIIRYLQVNFVTESINKDFSMLTLFTSEPETSEPTSKGIAPTSNNFRSTKGKLFYVFANSYNEVLGNTISLKYYYNGTLVETVNLESLNTTTISGNEYYYYSITESGHHRLVLTDLAGNTAVFSKFPYLDVYLINKVLYKINSETPINNQIFNSNVTLDIIDKLSNIPLCNISAVEVYKNGIPYEITETTTNRYIFSEAGSYTVYLYATTTLTAGEQIPLDTELNFTIINKKSALRSYNISSGKNFIIKSIERKMEDLPAVAYTNIPVTNKNSLNLTSTSEILGTGFYRITVQSYVNALRKNMDFTFEVWINNELPAVVASVPYGTNTTDPIVISYNLQNIYSKIGESKLVINGYLIANINAESENAISNYTLEVAGDYWIEIYSMNGQLLASYKVTKNAPLNATAQIIIVLVATLIVVLTIFFIILRKKTRFK